MLHRRFALIVRDERRSHHGRRIAEGRGLGSSGKRGARIGLKKVVLRELTKPRMNVEEFAPGSANARCPSTNQVGKLERCGAGVRARAAGDDVRVTRPG